MASPQDQRRRTIVVTGANRGVGRELAAQLAARGERLVVTARDPDAAEGVAASLPGGGHTSAAFDLTDVRSIDEAVTGISASPGGIDALVNNAAFEYDTDQQAVTADLDRVARAFEGNVLGAWRLTQGLLPHLRRGGVILMVNSGLGSLSRMTGGTPAYRVSKVALNALIRMLASELHGRGVDVRSVSPGWTATDMGGPGGRPVADGAASIVAALDLPPGTTGVYVQDGHELPW